MTKYYCDHCGKEIKYDKAVSIEGDWYYRGSKNDLGDIRLELCVECAKKAFNALKVTTSLN